MSENAIKETLKRFPYGFYSLTSRSSAGDDVNAMVFNWFSQVAFSPRLVAIGLQKSCYSHGLIAASGVFAVNVFNQEDKEALMSFTKGRSKNPDKMKTAEFELSPEVGCPILKDAAAYLECKVVQFVDLDADHDILVGEVVNGGVIKPGAVEDTLTLPDIGWSYAG
jgi:flavin reductase (DIM6/NTAB) family NADH-FMN oxidoreductase RutF